jgi:hypothetical protein
MSRRTQILCLLALLPACGESCACGGGGDLATVPARDAKAVAPAGAAPSADASQMLGTEPPPSAALLAMRNTLVPNEDSDQRKKLENAAAKIDGTSDLGDPRPAESFRRALPDRVGHYIAEGAALTGTTIAEAGTATTAARRYRSGESLMNVKITDTADAPGVRRELAEQLAMTGNAPTGHQRGRIDGAITGVLAYHENVRASRAMALIGGRFLVEVMVEQADEEDVAWSAIEAIDAKALKR